MQLSFVLNMTYSMGLAGASPDFEVANRLGSRVIRARCLC